MLHRPTMFSVVPYQPHLGEFRSVPDGNLRSQQIISKPVYTVPEFCLEHRISRSLLYKLLQQRNGPRIMKVGKRTLITIEAAEAWRRSLEKAA